MLTIDSKYLNFRVRGDYERLSAKTTRWFYVTTIVYSTIKYITDDLFDGYMSNLLKEILTDKKKKPMEWHTVFLLIIYYIL